jgi:hypothetical protein
MAENFQDFGSLGANRRGSFEGHAERWAVMKNQQLAGAPALRKSSLHRRRIHLGRTVQKLYNGAEREAVRGHVPKQLVN